MGNIVSSRSRTYDYNEIDEAQRMDVLSALHQFVLQEYKHAKYGGYQVEATSRCYTGNNRIIENVPLAEWRKAINVITKQPYILTEVECDSSTFLKVNFVMNNTNPAPSKLIARNAIIAGLQRADICPITQDSLAEASSYCVNYCGHVFSGVAKKCATCPLCGAPAAWTFVKRRDVLADTD